MGYNKKAQNKNFFSSLSKLLEEWKVSYTTDKIIIGGEFNLADPCYDIRELLYNALFECILQEIFLHYETRSFHSNPKIQQR